MHKKDVVKIRILGIVTIILLCIATTVKSFQNDTFYIIKLGQDILTRGVDLIDHYCWITDLSYTYPHWLYDVLLYLIYDSFNYFGVYVSTIILFIILVICVYIIQLKTNKNEFLALFIAFLSIGCLCGFATARSQLITIILYILQVYFIERIINSGNKRYIIFLILISLIVANVHATIWMFTFVLYLPYIVSYLIDKFINSKYFKKSLDNKKIIIEEIKNIKLVVISFIFSFLMGLFSPSRICYTYIFRVMMGVSQEYIMEHAPMIVIENPMFIILSFLLILMLIFSNVKIKLKELFMLCGLILMSLVSGRHLIFFYTIGLLYISVLVMRYLNERQDRSLDILGRLLVKNKLIYGCMFVLIFSGFIYNYSKIYYMDYVPEHEYPVDAVKYIKDNLDVDELRLYNDYNYGSYLLYNDIFVFTDSRCDLYLPEFNGLDYNIFEDNMLIVGNYQEKMMFYNVSHVLLNKEETLYKILINDDNYKEIYSDTYFVLFERISYEEKSI